MEITHMGTLSSYGVRLWKSGMISLRTTSKLPYLGRLYSPKMPGGHRFRWHVDKVLDPRVIISLFALNCMLFFVLLKQSLFPSIHKIIVLLSHVEPTKV